MDAVFVKFVRRPSSLSCSEKAGFAGAMLVFPIQVQKHIAIYKNNASLTENGSFSSLTLSTLLISDVPIWEFLILKQTDSF